MTKISLFKREADNYTLYGALFGFLFPLFATIFEALHSYGSLSWEHVRAVQSENVLLWIIDSAPFWLGLFARWGGIRQDIVEKQKKLLSDDIVDLETGKSRLEELVNEKTQYLEEALVEAEAANRAKSKFLSTMSHELRTPLNGIIGFNQLLKEPVFGPLNEKQLDFVNQVESSSHHLLDLVNDLLEVSRIDSGDTEIIFEEVIPEQLIDETLKTVEVKAKEKGVILESTSDPKIECFIANKRKCKQILLNLLSNAIKFTPADGRIDLCLRLQGTDVKFEVRDTGVGIPPDVQDRLFSEFYQVDRQRDEALGGTGIGLALSARLVHLHGGEIGVESVPDQGSVFWFTIPQENRRPSESCREKEK